MEKVKKQDKAYLGIFYENEGENTFIKANKLGLEFFIDELIKKKDDFDYHVSKEDHFSIIPFKKKEWFDNDSHITLDWIEPTQKDKNAIINDNKSNREHKSNWIKEKFQEWFFFAIIIFIGLCILIGFINIIGFISKLLN